MTETTIVYGASDDLIEVEGPVNEEFNPLHDDEPYYLAFSNGVVLKVQYENEGTWLVRPVAGHDLVAIDFAKGEDAGPRPDNSPGYSDRATITGPVTWVVGGDRFEAGR